MSPQQQQQHQQPKYTLYTPEASFRAFAVLIAAECSGVAVDAVTGEAAAAAAARLSPVGRLPVLECPGDGAADSADGAIIFSSHAAARYVGGMRCDAGLLGGPAATDRAAIDAWMDWCATDVELPATVWFYPVAGYMPFHAASYEKAKTDLGTALATLEAHLKADDNHQQKRTYLVGNRLTLADIVVVSTLLYPFKLVCDRHYRQPYPATVQWFQHCVSRPEFRQVVGTVALCEKELKAPGQ